MHLAQRAYVLSVLTATLAIVALWADEPALTGLWKMPAVLLLAGLAFEGFFLRRAGITASVEMAPRAFLGRPTPAAFTIRNSSSRPLSIQYVPLLPEGFEPMRRVRAVSAPALGVGRDVVSLLPIRLGRQTWPAVPGRVLGPLGLAWWTRELHPWADVSIAPDTYGHAHARPRGNPLGSRPRRAVGAGSELHQLRGYAPGDPLGRIDWKATARTRQLVSREFSEDQHLDILIAIDAGRFSRVPAGRLDRLGLYANIAARFAEVAIPNEDRVGLLVYSDRVLTMCPPGRGLPAMVRLRRALERLSVQPAESDATGAAVRIRGMLRHRGLVVLLTDLDDPAGAEQISRAVRLLSPPHLVVVAGVRNREVAELANREARDWVDPWVALAAQEHEVRSSSQRVLLRRLGAPVVVATEALLEQSVIAEYERLRRTRRV
jgi:uncharacterized protein (DUF58 family)